MCVHHRPSIRPAKPSHPVHHRLTSPSQAVNAISWKYTQIPSYTSACTCLIIMEVIFLSAASRRRFVLSPTTPISQERRSSSRVPHLTTRRPEREAVEGRATAIFRVRTTNPPKLNSRGISFRRNTQKGATIQRRRSRPRSTPGRLMIVDYSTLILTTSPSGTPVVGRGV
jgi:hypothetical protein